MLNDGTQQDPETPQAPEGDLFGPGVDKTKPTPLCVSGKTLAELRKFWGNKCSKGKTKMRNVVTKEISKYMKVFRHEMEGLMAGRMPKDRIDVNVVYPIIKSLVPQLYYRDPKVLIEALKAQFEFEEDAVVPQADGSFAPDPAFPNGKKVEVVDGPKAAYLLSGAINRNLVAAKSKKEFKMSIQDALICNYGAMKLGWDNEHGVFDMAPGDVPPSRNSSVQPGMAYAIRMKPWDVIVDNENFYNPQWVAFRWAVNPWDLKTDKRLLNTKDLKGTTSVYQERTLGAAKAADQVESAPLVEYYELFHRPSAEYPQGFMMIISDEVKEDFLFLDKFPTEKTTELPVALIYFNPDPEGGLPIPGIRYYYDQQKAASNIDTTEYEYIKRTLPLMVVNKTNLDDAEKQKAQLQSGNIPRIIFSKDAPEKTASGISFNNLNMDFRLMRQRVDDNVSRTVGMLSGSGPAGIADQKLAANTKAAGQSEAVRTGEMADTVRDFVISAISYWVSAYQEYSGEDMSSMIDAPQEMFSGHDMRYPIKFSIKDIRGQFIVKIKPFSNNYEDPAILRRQILDRMNLLSSPAVAQVLQRKGKMYDLERDINSLLETYDDRNADRLLIDYQPTPQEQMALEAQKQGLAAGQAPAGAPPVPGPLKPGGGNKEGMPVNGVAAKQDLLREPINPNTAKSAASLARQATVTR